MIRLAAVTIFTASLAASVLCAACAPSDPNAQPVVSATEQRAMKVECENDDPYACKSLDEVRQAQDEQDYRDEPALGYLTTPQGLYLPIPTVSHGPAGSQSQPN